MCEQVEILSLYRRDMFFRIKNPCAADYYEFPRVKIKICVLCGNPFGSFKKTTQNVIKFNYAERSGGETTVKLFMVKFLNIKFY